MALFSDSHANPPIRYSCELNYKKAKTRARESRRLVTLYLHSPPSFSLLEVTTRMSDFLTTRMSDFYNSDVGFLQLGCRIFTTWMSDFNNSDVGLLQLGCRILTTRMSDFNNSDVGFSTTQMAPTSFRTAL